MVSRREFGCRQPWSSSSNIPTFNEVYQPLEIRIWGMLTQNSVALLLQQLLGFLFAESEGLSHADWTPMTELYAKSKTFVYSFYSFTSYFFEYRKWRVQILVGDFLDFFQCFQTDAGIILKSGPNRFLSLPLPFVTSIHYHTIIRCCLVTVTGSIVKYVWTNKDKQSDSRRSISMWFSVIYTLNL
jgi:hypothetical protein